MFLNRMSFHEKIIMQYSKPALGVRMEALFSNVPHTHTLTAHLTNRKKFTFERIPQVVNFQDFGKVLLRFDFSLNNSKPKCSLFY